MARRPTPADNSAFAALCSRRWAIAVILEIQPIARVHEGLACFEHVTAEFALPYLIHHIAFRPFDDQTLRSISFVNNYVVDLLRLRSEVFSFSQLVAIELVHPSIY